MIRHLTDYSESVFQNIPNWLVYNLNKLVIAYGSNIYNNSYLNLRMQKTSAHHSIQVKCTMDEPI